MTNSNEIKDRDSSKQDKQNLDGASPIILMMEKVIIDRMSKKLRISRHTALEYLRKKTKGYGIETSFYLNVIATIHYRDKLAKVFEITLDERND